MLSPSPTLPRSSRPAQLCALKKKIKPHEYNPLTDPPKSHGGGSSNKVIGNKKPRKVPLSLFALATLGTGLALT